MRKYLGLFLTLMLLLATASPAYSTPTKQSKYISAQAGSGVGEIDLQWRAGDGAHRALIISTVDETPDWTHAGITAANLKTSLEAFQALPGTNGDYTDATSGTFIPADLNVWVIAEWTGYSNSITLTNLTAGVYEVRIIEFDLDALDNYECFEIGTETTLNPRTIESKLAKPVNLGMENQDGVVAGGSGTDGTPYSFTNGDYPVFDWDAVAGASGYYLDVLDIPSVDFVDPYDLLDIGAPTSTKFEIFDVYSNTNFTAGNKEKIRVRAYDADGKLSPASDWKYFTVPSDVAPEITSMTTAFSGVYNTFNNGDVNVNCVNVTNGNGATLTVTCNFNVEMKTTVAPAITLIDGAATNMISNSVFTIDATNSGWRGNKKYVAVYDIDHTQTYQFDYTTVDAIATGTGDITADVSNPTALQNTKGTAMAASGAVTNAPNQLSVDLVAPSVTDVSFVSTLVQEGGTYWVTDKDVPTGFEFAITYDEVMADTHPTVAFDTDVTADLLTANATPYTWDVTGKICTMNYDVSDTDDAGETDVDINITAGATDLAGNAMATADGDWDDMFSEDCQNPAWGALPTWVYHTGVGENYYDGTLTINDNVYTGVNVTTGAGEGDITEADFGFTFADGTVDDGINTEPTYSLPWTAGTASATLTMNPTAGEFAIGDETIDVAPLADAIFDVHGNPMPTTALTPVALPSVAPTVASIAWVGAPASGTIYENGETPAVDVTFTQKVAVDASSPTITIANAAGDQTLNLVGGAGAFAKTHTFTAVGIVAEELCALIKYNDAITAGANAIENAAGDDAVATLNAVTVADLSEARDADGVEPTANAVDLTGTPVNVGGPVYLARTGGILTVANTGNGNAYDDLTAATCVDGETVVYTINSTVVALSGAGTDELVVPTGLVEGSNPYSVTMTVTDDAGNTDNDATAVFNIDDTKPTVTDVAVTCTGVALIGGTWVTDAHDTRTDFEVTLTFSEEMDQTVIPTLSFTADVADGATPTLTNEVAPTSGAWTDATHCDFTYTIADVDVTIEDIDITINTAADLAGNVMDEDATTGVDEFSIDTENPTWLADGADVDTDIDGIADMTYDGRLINTYTTQIKFSEAVYGSTGAADDLVEADFTKTLTTNANGELTSATYAVSHSAGNTWANLVMTPAAGEYATGAETLVLDPALATSIYDVHSNPMLDADASNTEPFPAVEPFIVTTNGLAWAAVAPATANLYKDGEAVTLDVTFSQDVTVTGTPVMTIDNGAGSTLDLNYVSTAANVLTFTSAVLTTELACGLDSYNDMTLTAATILNDNSVAFDRTDPGTPDALGTPRSVDAIEPSITGFVITETRINDGGTLNVTAHTHNTEGASFDCPAVQTYVESYTVDGNVVVIAGGQLTVPAIGGNGNINVVYTVTDDAGNTDTETIQVFLDNTKPTVSSVAITSPTVALFSEGGSDWVTDAHIGITDFNVVVTFVEAMDTSIDPTIAFSAGTSSLTLGTPTWDVTDMICTIPYTVVEQDTELADIDITVTAATDVAGNMMDADATHTDKFSIDTENPDWHGTPIAAITYDAGTNTYETTLTFDDLVYTDAAGTGDLVLADLAQTFVAAVGGLETDPTFTVTPGVTDDLWDIIFTPTAGEYAIGTETTNFAPTDGASIYDVHGNAMAVASCGAETFPGQVPRVMSMAWNGADANTDNVYMIGETVAVDVTFTQVVSVAVATPTLTIDGTSGSYTMDYSAGTGTKVLTFSRNVTTEVACELDAYNAITLGAATITNNNAGAFAGGTVGTVADLTTPRDTDGEAPDANNIFAVTQTRAQFGATLDLTDNDYTDLTTNCNLTETETYTIDGIPVTLATATTLTVPASGAGWTSVEGNTIDVVYTVTDDAGNTDSETTTFILDNTKPTVVVTVNAPTSGWNTASYINDDNDGDNIDVVLTFNEDMDSSVDPTLTFNTEITTTLDNPSYVWSNNVGTNDRCTVTYDVNDTGVDFTGVDIEVSVAQDIAFNVMVTATTNDLFDVDTENPTWDATTPVANISYNAGANTYSTTVTFDDNVYGTADGVTGNLDNTDFTPTFINAAGGLVTAPGYAYAHVAGAQTATLTITPAVGEYAIGTETLRLAPVVSSIYDVHGNVMATTPVSNAAPFQGVPPTVASIAWAGAAPVSGTIYKNGETVTLTATFTQPVVVDVSGGAPTMTIDDGAGGTAFDVTYTGGTGTAILTFATPVTTEVNCGLDTYNSITIPVASSIENTNSIAFAEPAVGSEPASILTRTIDGVVPVANVAFDVTEVSAQYGATINLTNNTYTDGTTVCNDTETEVYTIDGIDVTPALPTTTLTVPASGAAWTAVEGDPINVVYTITDAAGNTDAVTTTFVLDNTKPTVNTLNVSDAWIGQPELTANSFVVTVAFNEDMNQAVAPVLTFTADVIAAGDLVLVGATWNSATECEIAYTLTDRNNVILDIDIDVATAQDIAGNVMLLDATHDDLFSIDTENPTWGGTPIAAISYTGANTYTTTLTFSEAVYTTFTDVSTGNAGSGALTDGDFHTAFVPDAGGLATTPTFAYVHSAGATTVAVTATPAVGEYADGLETYTATPVNGVAIYDAHGNEMAMGYPGAVNFPSQPPTVTGMAWNGTPAVGTIYAAGETVSVDVTFSQIVNVAGGVPILTIDDGSGGTTLALNYASGDATNTLTFTSAVLTNEVICGLVAYDAIALNGGTITNNGGGTFVAPGSASNLASARSVDAVAPVISAFTITETRVKAGDDLTVTAHTYNVIDATTDCPNPQTYTETYTVDGTAATLVGGLLNVPGGTAEGNIDVVYTVTDEAGNTDDATVTVFVDNTLPTITGIVVSDSWIGQAQVTANTFTVEITFDENMDPTTNPTVAFNAGVADGATPTITVASYAWTAGLGANRICTVTYTVADQDITIPDVDITVSGAQDVVSNVMLTDNSFTDEFSIDTENPDWGTTPLGTISYDDFNNEYKVTLTFTEPVYSANDGTGTMAMTELTPNFTVGTGLTTEPTYSLNHNLGGTTAQIVMTPNGSESADGSELLSVTAPKVTDAIYDAHGNEMTSVTSNQVVFPAQPPLVASMAWNGGTAIYKNGDVVSIDVTFNQTVDVTGTPVLTIDDSGVGTTLVLNYVSGTGSATLTFTSAAISNEVICDLDTYVSITYPTGGDYIENAGNAYFATPGSLAGSIATRSIDGEVPEIHASFAIDGTTDPAKSGGTITLTNHSYADATTGCNTTETSVYTVGGFTVVPVGDDITVPAVVDMPGVTGDGSVNVVWTVTDDAGNSDTETVSFTLDNTAPTVDALLDNTTLTTVRVEFDGPVLGATTITNYTLTTDDLVNVPGWNSSNPSAVSNISGNIYELTVPYYGLLGNGKSVTVTVTGVADAAGNDIDPANDEATYANINAPTITVIDWDGVVADDYNTADGALDFTIEFDVDVNVNTAPTVTLNNGSAAVYVGETSAGVLAFTTTATGDGEITIASMTGVVEHTVSPNPTTDMSTYAGALDLANVIADNTDPTVDADLTVINSQQIQVIFDEAVTGATTLTNYTLSTDDGALTFTGNPSVASLASGNTYNLVVPNFSTLANSKSIFVTVANVTDDAGNTISAPNNVASYIVDGDPQLVSSTWDFTDCIATGTDRTLTLEFDVDLHATSTGTITFTNGETSVSASVSGTDMTFETDASGDGTITIASVNITAVNNSDPSYDTDITSVGDITVTGGSPSADNTAPVVTWDGGNLASGSKVNATPFSIAYTVADVGCATFDATGITIVPTNCTISLKTTTGFTVTPTGGNVSFTVTYEDDLGNDDGGTAFSYVYDATAPQVTPPLAATSSTTLKVEFNEDMDVTSAETAANYTLTTTSGSLSAMFSGGNPTSVAQIGTTNEYTLTVDNYSALANTESITVTVANVTDEAGNTIDASNDDATYLKDENPVLLTSVWDATSCYATGTDRTLTLTFDVNLDATSTGTITFANGESNVSRVVSGTTMTFDTDASGDGVIALSTVAIDAKNDSDPTKHTVINSVGSVSITGGSPSADNSGPVVAMDGANPVSGTCIKSAINIAYTATDAGCGTFDATNVIVTPINCTISAKTVTGFTVTPTAFPVSFNVSFADALGNTSASSPYSFAYTYDPTAPSVAIGNAGSVNGSTLVNVVITDTQDPTPTEEVSVDNTTWDVLTAGMEFTDITGFDAIADGTFTLYARGTDCADNVGTDSQSLNKDTQDPAVVSTLAIPTTTTVEVTFTEAITDGTDTDNYLLTTDDTALTAWNVVNLHPSNAVLKGGSTIIYVLTVPNYATLANGKYIQVEVSGVTDLTGNDLSVTNNDATYTKGSVATPPVLSSSAWDLTGCYNSGDNDVTLTLSFDVNLHASSTAYASFNNGESSISGSVVANTITFTTDASGDGTIDLSSINIDAKNAADQNQHTPITSVASVTVTGSEPTADNTDPAVTWDAGNPVTGDCLITDVVTLDYTVVEAGCGTFDATGITIYDMTNCTVTTAATTTAFTVTASAAGTFSFKATFEDGIGNTSQVYSYSYVYDNAAPDLSALTNDGTTRLILTFSEEVANLTGATTVSNYTLTDDDPSWSGSILSIYSTSGNNVTFTVTDFTALASGKTITITGDNITDCASNSLDDDDATYTKATALALAISYTGNLYANTDKSMTVSTTPATASINITVEGVIAATNGSGVASFTTVNIDDSNLGLEGIEDYDLIATGGGATTTEVVDVLPEKPTETPTIGSVIVRATLIALVINNAGDIDDEDIEGVVVNCATTNPAVSFSDGTSTNATYSITTSALRAQSDRAIIRGLSCGTTYYYSLASYNIGNSGATYASSKLASFSSNTTGNATTTYKESVDGEDISGMFGMRVDNVYPNPASSEFSLDIFLLEELELTISIIDQEGRTILTPVIGRGYKAGENTISIDLDNVIVASGNYFISIVAGDKAVVTPIQIVK